LDHLTRKIIPDITYTMFGWTLNPTKLSQSGPQDPGVTILD